MVIHLKMRTCTHVFLALPLTCRIVDDSLVDAHIPAWQRVGEHHSQKETEMEMEMERERARERVRESNCKRACAPAR